MRGGVGPTLGGHPIAFQDQPPFLLRLFQKQARGWCGGKRRVRPSSWSTVRSTVVPCAANVFTAAHPSIHPFQDVSFHSASLKGVEAQAIHPCSTVEKKLSDAASIVRQAPVPDRSIRPDRSPVLKGTARPVRSRSLSFGEAGRKGSQMVQGRHCDCWKHERRVDMGVGET